MTREEAESELMQLYGSLSEEKKKALDVLMAQEDGEYISRTELLKAINTWDRFGVDDTNSLFRLDNLSLPHYVAYIHYDDVVKCIKGLPSVDIPPDHDGCKDCKYETYPEYYYPCCECKQNYEDEWQKKPHWIMKHRTINEVKYHTGLDDMGEEHTIKELIRYEVDEPYCSECGMKAGDTSQNYCCFCGTKMGGELE